MFCDGTATCSINIRLRVAFKKTHGLFYKRAAYCRQDAEIQDKKHLDAGYKEFYGTCRGEHKRS